jgi:hypothetical protein
MEIIPYHYKVVRVGLGGPAYYNGQRHAGVSKVGPPVVGARVVWSVPVDGLGALLKRYSLPLALAKNKTGGSSWSWLIAAV